MQSTLSIFPGTRRVLNSTKLPFVIYTTPIPDDLPTFQSGTIDVPRCPNPSCTAFFSGLCHYGLRSWTCSVCGCQCSSSPPLSVASLANYQIVDSSVAFPLTHVVVIGCEDVSPAHAIMWWLPPDAPVQIFVMNSGETPRKLVTIAGSLSQLRRLPDASVRVSVGATLPVLATLLNAKKCCFWCRVFCSSENLDDHVSKLKQFDRIPIRIDYFLEGPMGSQIQAFREQLPGICRLFGNVYAASEIAALDCARAFGFQCKVNLKCGPNFKATCETEKATLPVIGSSKAVVPFSVLPVQKENNLGFQAVQVLAHVHVWDPPTNALRKCTNILNGDFPVSNDYVSVLKSASSSALFDYFCRHRQFQSLDGSRRDLLNLRPLFEMKRIMSAEQNFDGLAAEFFDLCQPVTWRFVLAAFADVWTVDDQIAAVILKRFPNVYIAVKDGKEVVLGDTVKKFVECCRPLNVNVMKVHLDEVNAIMERIKGEVVVVKH
jgi:hypothetical protein